MTILEKPPPSGDPHAGQGAGIGSAIAIRLCVTPRHGSTRRLPKNKRDGNEAISEYARICEQVRLAKGTGGEASRCAVEAKAAWDARVGAQRQANDDAQRAHHALKVDQTVRRSRATSRNSSHFRFRSRGTRTSVDNEPTKLEAR